MSLPRSQDPAAPSQGKPLAGNRVSVDVDVGQGLELPGVLTIPREPRGVIVFALSSGTSRLTTSNRRFARALNVAGLTTLLFDLLTLPEQAGRRSIFDVPLLARRLTAATGWLRRQAATGGGPLGYLGASVGGAAALCAAAQLAGEVGAVVLCGGRADLVESCLAQVVAPTLLIVGGKDLEVLELCRRARSQLHCLNELAVVPGAGHEFEEPGAHDRVADLAIDWFTRHLSPEGRTTDP